MSTTAELLQAQKRKAQKALDNKVGIKRALDARRFKDVGENQSTWESEIYAIEPPLEMLTISENGEYDVKDYKKVNVGIVAQGDEVLIDVIEGDIVNLTIPYGATTNRPYKFYQSLKLESVKFPETYIDIGHNTFNACIKLKSVELNEGMTGIYDQAFFGCTALEHIELPSTVTKLGKQVFNGCKSLKSVEIPSGLTTIGQQVFNGCTSLDNLKLSEGLKVLGDDMFSGCTSLKNVTIPKSITNIPTGCFSHTALEHIEIPSTVTVIGSGAFQYTKLVQIKIPSGVTNLESGILGNCKSLKSVEIPSGVTNIKDSCFFGTSKLTELNIPASVTNIESRALQIGSSTNKAIIVMNSITPPTINLYTFDKSYLNKIYVPQGTRNTYITATNWSKFADYILERNNVIVNVPSGLLNNENYTYSLDNGVTYSQFTNSTLALQDIAVIKMKSTTADTTILIGTTSGGNDVGTISNSELTFSFSGDTTIYLTIQ